MNVLLKTVLTLFLITTASACAAQQSVTDEQLTRSDYNEVEEIRMPEMSGDLSPTALATALLEQPAEEECLQWKQSKISREADGVTAVVYTIMGLCDDSLGGIEHRYDLIFEDSGYKIDWAGERYYCRRTDPSGWIEPGNYCL